MNWFTSDEHYGHLNIIKFCNRPFLGLHSMRDGLIARHNEVVGKDDITYHIGDIFWRTLAVEEAFEILSRLNGQHVYVLGNHDELIHGNWDLRNAFSAVYERVLIKPEAGPKNGIVLDHFAGRVWHHSDKGSWQLYGHTHAVLPEIDPLLSFDVGVDANNYYPVSLTQVAERMNAKIARIQRGLGVKTK